MNKQEIPLWMAFAHARDFSNRRKMAFLVQVLHKNQMSLNEAMEEIKRSNRLGFNFMDKEWQGLNDALNELPNYSFLAEELINKGISVIHAMEDTYPISLKKNLVTDAPVLLYCKGNTHLLHQMNLAVVGARNSSDKALKFTDKVVEKAVNEDEVIVSGFAKGVDKRALEAALQYGGKSIIVLPQGIDTFNSKPYYQEIIKGQVLVLSTYHPKVPWSVGLAMDRNAIIYGLAQHIIVAESNSSGGTWEGVMHGLKKGRQIFVRVPGASENNANHILIEKGAIGINENGTIAQVSSQTCLVLAEPATDYPRQNIEAAAIDYLKSHKGGLSSAILCQYLKLPDTQKKKITTELSKSEKLIKIKQGSDTLFYLKDQSGEQQRIDF